MTSSYPLIFAEGTHRELGRQHGRQCRDLLKRFVEYLAEGMKITREELHGRAMQFLPLYEKHCPHLVEEIEGLAEGAGVPLAEALAVQIRGEMGQVKADGGCTTYVIAAHQTKGSGILIGQNSDMPSEMQPFGYVLHLAPKDKPEVLMWTFGGQLGYHGVNAAGVAHFANALGGGPKWRFGLPHYPVKRMILERRTVEEVLALFAEAPVCSNGNYVLCGGEGRIVDVELTPEGPNVIEDEGRGYLAHSNHFLCAPHACEENFAKSLPDSFPRLERMRTLIEGRLSHITVDDVKQFLSDHDGHPTSICRHPHDGHGDDILPNTGRTICSLIAEPAEGRLHVCCGNPCENVYEVHSLRG